MKHILTFLTGLFIAITTMAQPTTESEYNYMKKGYKISIESGLDVKTGYFVEELPLFENTSVIISATKLFRTDGSLVGFIIKCQSLEAFGSGTNYYAIPTVNTTTKRSAGWDQFYTDLNDMTCGMRQYVIEWMAYRLVYESKK